MNRFPYGFRRLLSAGGVQIAQPDLAYCGGISEALKIRTIASSLGVNVIPHCWGTMLNLAAATHFLASSYREPGRAEDGGAILELDRTPNPLRDELFAAEKGVTLTLAGHTHGTQIGLARRSLAEWVGKPHFLWGHYPDVSLIRGPKS